MREILADLVAEQQGLDQFLQSTSVRDWNKATPAKGWDVRDTIAHLADSEEYAYSALAEDGAKMKEAMARYATFDEATKAGVLRGRAMREQDVIEWWRHARASVVDALSYMTGDERVPWLTGDMSARTLATTRMMETWAHGLDLHAAFDDEVEDTPRIRHIAFLGWLMLPYSFQKAGKDYSTPVRVELMGPGYAKWVYGPADTDEVIKGPAGDWCRVVVQRMKPKDSELVAEGAVAATALRVARAYE